MAKYLHYFSFIAPARPPPPTGPRTVSNNGEEPLPHGYLL